jgi:hypothetical protein
VLELVALGAAEDGGDLEFCMGRGVLLRVAGFDAASTLLMKSEPKSGLLPLMMHSMSSGKVLGSSIEW